MSGITLYLSGILAYFEVSTLFKGIAKEIIWWEKCLTFNTDTSCFSSKIKFLFVFGLLGAFFRNIPAPQKVNTFWFSLLFSFFICVFCEQLAFLIFIFRREWRWKTDSNTMNSNYRVFAIQLKTAHSYTELIVLLISFYHAEKCERKVYVISRFGAGTWTW